MFAITKAELKKMREQDRDVIMINVLDHDQFNEGHINGSVNVPADQPQFVQMVSAISGGKEREIIVYSASSDCGASGKAAQKLTDAGFVRIYDYQGGMADWRGEDSGAGKTQELPREHREWLSVVGREPKPSVNEQ